MSDATVGTYMGDLPSMLARSRMKNEIVVIDESIRVLRSRRNALVPVSSLPPELLGAIFLLHFRNCRSKYYYHDRTKKSIAVTHVCQRWWSVAFMLPSLWNTPPVDLPRWFDEMVIRSKAAPLVLEVDFPPRKVEFDQIIKHIARTRALTVNLYTSTSVDCLVHFAGSAPLLEALNIMAPVHMPAHRLTVDLFGRDTPRLREVALTHCNISWTSPLLIGLTHLNIEQVTTAARPTLYQVLSALALMPSLVALRLVNALPIIQDDANPLPSYVTLPALSRLWLVGSVAECMGVLPRLDYPSNTAICLSCNDTVATGTGFAAIRKPVRS
ncbi:hypothetical protein BV22DRAFT_1118309 [Leucogyrophana mollusca]|uniref:Uncharacterized protein n=1 Tax=Leucogyrophana mollusca TaxID=85980 RepID=A0ACB8BP77_9AGAM|nr:hypothetical protein BV22DRAFT_1118309 [Leucogyrophana mollusca]